MADTLASSRSVSDNASILARTVIVAQDLCEELERWSVYASAAEEEAEYTATLAGEQITIAIRQAASVADLVERSKLDLESLAAIVDETATKAEHTVAQLAARAQSWKQTEQIALQATVSWSAAVDRAEDDKALHEIRLKQARKRVERLASESVTTSSSSRRFVRSRYITRGEERRKDRHAALADARRLVNDLETQTGPLTRQAECCNQALATCREAMTLVRFATDELAEGLQAAGMAHDYAVGAKQSLATSLRLLAGQRAQAESILRESRAAVRQGELAGRLLGAVSSTYDDAQRHVFDARQNINERVEALRERSGRHEGLRL